MKVYKLIVAYDGTYFKGWQTQTKNPNTAQEFLTTNLQTILKSSDFHLYAASRTDALVHASFQVIKLETSLKIDTVNIIRGFNQKWGAQLKILNFDLTCSDFNPLQEILYKEYRYSFSLTEPHPLQSNFVYFQRENVDVKLIKKACQLVVGTHDFTYLSVKGSGPENRVRTVTLCELENFKSSLGDEVFYIKIQASGFLKYMVRMLVNAILRVGTGEISIDDFKQQLSGMNIFKPKKAKPHGLNLFFIRYK